MSSMWRLEAKGYRAEGRDKRAKTAVFYFGPGVHSVGRLGSGSTIEIAHDASISRTHATLHVVRGSELGDEPCIVVKDSSRYGTRHSLESVDLDDASPLKEQKVHSGSYLKFGHLSPFRLFHVNILLRFLKEDGHVLQGKVHELGISNPIVSKAFDAGFGITSCGKSPHVRLVCFSPEAPHCLATLCALCLHQPVVRSSWVEAWTQNRVWTRPPPAEGEHAAASLSPEELAALRAGRPLQGLRMALSDCLAASDQADLRIILPLLGATRVEGSSAAPSPSHGKKRRMPASPLPEASATLDSPGVVWIVADGKRPGDRTAWVALDALVSCLFAGTDVASHIHRVGRFTSVEAVSVDTASPRRKKSRSSPALGTGLLSELLAANDAAVVSDSETESEEDPLLCSPLGLIENARRGAPTNGGVAEAISSKDEGQDEPLATPTAVADAPSPKLSSLEGWRDVVRDAPPDSVNKKAQKTPEKSSGAADGDGGYDVVTTVVEETLLVAPARSSRRLRFGESATPSRPGGRSRSAGGAALAGVDYKRFRRKQAA